jgi:hypothetical protein
MTEGDKSSEITMPEATAEVAREAMRTLDEAGVRFLVSGAYALGHYTGIERHTKDFDICVRASDIDDALSALADQGFETEVSSDIWLAKAHLDGQLVDLVFNSGHAEHPVDDSWFDRAGKREMLGRQAEIVPVEELVRSKAFIMERERYDGADVAHLLLCGADRIDWDHMLECFGGHWPMLYAHLVMFHYIYPAHQDRIPDEVMQELADRVDRRREEAGPDEEICQGTLLSRTQYLVDIDEWGMTDGRLEPHGTLSPKEARELSPRDEES